MKNKDDNDKKEIKELDRLISEFRPSHEIYVKLLAVRDVKSGETRTDVGKKLCVHRVTVGNWVKAYDEDGIDGLYPNYENCGLKCRLSNEQLLKLKKILTNPEKSYTLKDAQRIIEREFSIVYSLKQVWVITRKKLGLNYCKPFIKYGEAPENADEILKEKTKEIDIKNEDLVIIDESRCQNTTNTARRFCEPKINGIKAPNILYKTGKRFGVNAVGFQGINCDSAIYFNQKNNANNFSITLCEYQISRIKNRDAKLIIKNAINDPKLDINNIKLELLKEHITEKEMNQLINENGEINEKKFKSLCKKYNINYYKINIRQRKHLLTNLNNPILKNLMNNERKLNLVLDNARIHTAKIVKEICEILSINLIFLPPYCPFLNPIEDVWKDVKKEIYNAIYDSLEELMILFEEKFYERVDLRSYYENWINEFLL